MSSRRSSYVVAAAVLISRVLGLAREVVMSALFGGSRAYDAFLAAFRAPNLLRDLFAEGALSQAYVTVFSKTREKEGDEASWRLACKILTLTGLFMGSVALAGVLLAPQIMAVMTPGFSPEEQAFATRLARILFPFIVLVSFAALVMGMLNARGIFFIPALSSSFFNVGTIVVGLGVGWWLDPEFGPAALGGVAVGVLAGGLFQWLVQVPSLHRQGFRFRPDFRFRDSGVARVIGLMIPAVIAGSAVQVNVVVNTAFASHLQEGSIVWLNNAFRLMQLPLGVFGVAVAVVALPELARLVARGAHVDFGKRIGSGLRLVFFLNVPSAVGLMVLAEPIMAVVYEHGRFSEFDRSMAAAGLRFYTAGLLGYSAIKVVQPAFYAIDRRYVPMFVAFLSIAVNASLNWFFIFRLGWDHRSLALSTAMVAGINFLLLYFLLRRFSGVSLEGGRLLRDLARIGGAAALMGGAGAGLWAVTADGFADWGLMARATWTVLAVAGCGGIYFALSLAMRLEEAAVVKRAVVERLAGRGTK